MEPGRSRTPFLPLLASFLIAAVCLPSAARAFCFAEGLQPVEDQTVVVEQLLLFVDGPEPSAILRCGFENAPGLRAVHIGLERSDLQPAAIPWDSSFDRLWSETAPRAVTWIPPSTLGTPQPVEPTEAPQAVVDQQWEQAIQRDSTFQLQFLPSPAETALGLTSPAALITLTLQEVPLASDPFFWLAPVQIPLVISEEGHPFVSFVDLPISIPEGSSVSPLEGDAPFWMAVDAAPTQTRTELTALVVSAQRYLGFGGMDPFDALQRGSFVAPEDALPVQPDRLTLLIPDVRLRVNRAGFERFDTFYRARLEEAIAGLEGNLAVLEYIGPLGISTRTGREIDSIAPLLAGPDRMVRVRLSGRFEQGLSLSPLAPAWFEATWFRLPGTGQQAQATTSPQDLSLSDDSLVFSFGAEPPAELSPGMVLQVITANSSQVGRCDPQLDRPTGNEVGLMVEPGGSAIGAFVRSDHLQTAACLVELFRAMPYLIATGPPVFIRFPIEFPGR
ncbi:MAG: hypothetical protein JW797_10535 [Bradymonadales bacterium]|nr:hypothetical protein [Bradymonadales bacterium]